MVLQFIEGGVCAAKGFKAAGIHCGIRKNKSKKDLALIVSETEASAASIYTQNLVKGAPLIVTKEHLKDGKAKAIICNSGNANTCNDNGIEIAEGICDILAKELGIDSKDVIVASTGVIGQKLSLSPFESGIPQLVKELGENSSAAADAIMTTDLKRKEIAAEFELSGKKCRMGAIAKGSGMIHPNMATMLCFITTDAAVAPDILHKALVTAANDTFNMLSVDGDTSTNDMVSILANGMADNPIISEENEDYNVFVSVLTEISKEITRMLAADGEGATKLLQCEVVGAKDKESAKKAAKSVICSSLFKAAMFGADANWGRVLCALGYSGADLDTGKIDVAFKSKNGYIEVCRNGAGVDFSEETAKEVLTADEIEILINLNAGNEKATAWGCDLSYDYVKINGDYRS
ncbi:MAG TPA: bifunctional ornithine acetyltransferase/N-acetylglutamate synthase [Clostridiales bacterium]|nr:bifunctional ornithine acetyltransferase/N-acetylglutamate synthase [Clostridiales bacterium]HOL78945.1 bifunctional ornithine acetyltransferase/N-acetylglutamate synthase [Clostridiales bacterium]HPU66934.1 bifunctional ornithine acetyltransferase/N-acetylglutamate synthase [Clostridiales bacterium]HQD72682.1 bifunctional ornithine acetyltransferase/N-acetylglutamate synthase [Clostridiales bacterium]HXK83665.1 bifunctional ornithine acetyltransferase/N-acetylglutamate synthase [Clostridial